MRCIKRIYATSHRSSLEMLTCIHLTRVTRRILLGACYNNGSGITSCSSIYNDNDNWNDYPYMIIQRLYCSKEPLLLSFIFEAHSTRRLTPLYSSSFKHRMPHLRAAKPPLSLLKGEDDRSEGARPEWSWHWKSPTSSVLSTGLGPVRNLTG